VAQRFRLKFTTEAQEQLERLRRTRSAAQHRKGVEKALGLLETNLRHPSLNTHEYTSLKGPNGEKIFEAYAETKTSGAWRIFWHYGPDKSETPGKQVKRIPVITVVAITPHP
jgi:hypothetical protein